MKKLVYLVVLAAFSTATVNAQDSSGSTQRSQGYAGERMNKKFIWSIGIESTLPLGHFNSYSSFGLGGSLQGEFKAADRLGITLNLGFIDYFGKTVDSIKYSDFKYWPLMAGLKWYLTDMFYIHGQAGPGFGTNGLGTSFWYGGGLGLYISKSIDLELKYTGWSQNVVNTSGGGVNYNNGGYGGGGNGGGGGGVYGGGYGGHYPTIGLRLAYNF
jgi:hypothetical protein